MTGGARAVSGRTVSRRAVIGAAAGLVVGAGIAEAADRLPTGSSTPTGPPPGETLMYEHGVLKRVLLAYQAALGHLVGDTTLAATTIHGCAEVIHDFIEGFHEALEEGYVFPLFQTGPLASTIDTLLLQHARGRLITQRVLAVATPAGLSPTSARQELAGLVTAFVRMYEPHEAREDTVVFPALRATLGPGQLEDLGQRFTDLQSEQLGRGAFADVLGRVDALEQALGIADLASFTPAAVSPS